MAASALAAVTPIQIATAVLGLLVAYFFYSWLIGRGGAGGSGSGSLPRTTLVLCGPSASGKTTLFQALVEPERPRKPTHTSMKVNAAWAVVPAGAKAMRRFEVVDCPGHLRLFDLTLDAFRSAKVICIVVDGVRVQDEHGGAASLASMLMTVLTAKETLGARIVVACNKRDEISSFSSRALQKLTEKELKQRLAQRSSGGVAAGSEKLKKSETLTLDENGEFDWDQCPRQIVFCDISGRAPEGKFVLDPVIQEMMM